MSEMNRRTLLLSLLGRTSVAESPKPKRKRKRDYVRIAYSETGIVVENEMEKYTLSWDFLERKKDHMAGKSDLDEGSVYEVKKFAR